MLKKKKQSKKQPKKIGENDYVLDITEEVSKGGKMVDFDLKNVNLKFDINQEDVVHYGVICDNCYKKQFKGIRYKCLTCVDFDLCQTCYDSHKHVDHEFQVIKKSNRFPFQNVVTHIVFEDNEINVEEINLKEEIKVKEEVKVEEKKVEEKKSGREKS